MSHHTNPPTYAAIFGRNPALSVAELYALSQTFGFEVRPLSTYTVELIGFELSLANRLGAITKIIELAPAEAGSAEEAVMAMAGRAPVGRRLRFGVSSYSSVPATPLNKLMKKMLTKRDISSGFLSKREGRSGRATDGELSAVQVYHNNLIGKGFDWAVLEAGDSFRYGHTVWVYDFAGFGSRDYDKPVSDTARGMLPPQLARAMVNIGTGGRGQAVYDPFCGVGVLLLESTLLGHRSFGSDVDERAIRDAEHNLTWLKEKYPEAAPSEIFAHDATQPLPVRERTALITEGYLGKLIRPDALEDRMLNEASEVEKIMQNFLRQAASIQKVGDRLVMTLPAWRLQVTLKRLALVDHASKYGYTKVRPLPAGTTLPGLTDRDTIEVARPKQRIIHELVILEKNHGTH